MSIQYWIYDGDWKRVNADEYNAFGGKKIIATEMGLGWALLMNYFNSLEKRRIGGEW